MTFKETQKFSPKILWALRAVLAVTALILALTYIKTDTNGLVLFAIFIFAVLPPFLLLEVAQLKTEFDAKGIKLKFMPFTKKTYEWTDIETAELINYGFVGGWGIRIGTKYGTVYNTRGNEGLWLSFKNGKKIVIGTQRRAELQRQLDKLGL